MKSRFEVVVAIVSPLLAVIFHRAIEQLSLRIAWLVSCILVLLAIIYTIRMVRKHRQWVARYHPWLAAPYITVLLPFLFCGSLLATGSAIMNVIFPTGSLNLTIVDSAARPLGNIKALLWDPSHPTQTGSGRVTDAVGAANFDHIPSGRKKVYLLRNLPDQSWEFMEVPIVIERDTTSRIWTFNPQHLSTPSLPVIHFTSGEAEIEVAEFLSLEAELAIVAKTGGRLLILGNTDERGTEDYNDKLGKSRASAVVAELQKHKAGNMRAFSFGKRWQRGGLNSNFTPDQVRGANRRVEQVLIPSPTDGIE